MIQLFICLFAAFLLSQNSSRSDTSHVFGYFTLPSLSKSLPNGIFNPNSRGNTKGQSPSSHLYFAPNDHAGVNALIKALITAFPDIEATGCTDRAEINEQYQENFFNSWAAIEFDLSEEQLSTGLLIPSESTKTVVSYEISIAPSNWGDPLTTYNYSSEVYNQQLSPADLYWSTGYLTLQNWIATYLAKNYSFVEDHFNVTTFIQRYPQSPIYPDQQAKSMDATRNSIWKWIGSTLLAVCLFTPMLSLLTEMVRERQYLMKDLLEISGMMNVAYYSSYLLLLFLMGEISCWFTIGMLRGFDILTANRMNPYAGLMTVYLLASGAFAMVFGFLIPKSEYYGLPIFLVTCALTVCGAYLAAAFQISIGLKLFLCFLSPSMGLTMGVIVIETYLYSLGDDNDSAAMDYHAIDENRNYPALNDINLVLFFSALFYFLLSLSLPFSVEKWVDGLLFENPRIDQAIAALVSSKEDLFTYPCDVEEEEEDHQGRRDNDILLNVENLSQVYPDGTHAVKDLSFQIRRGEVLSFLGANGAGKSTTMQMLCGTLAATSGDASIQGYSIAQEKILARRNLGIAMQQDVLWEDVNVEDHLLLFGRLRGLHGTALREAVSNMCLSLGFPEKKKFLAGTLSGGQKRRLCVALAMVGDNGVVFLDEPTSGLDPVSRRQLWELIAKNRADRAILLTTHFMDEADILGDRIAILKEGRLRALGSSKFLKQRFGVGYLLRMSLQAEGGAEGGAKEEEATPSSSLITSSSTSSGITSRILNEVQAHIPAASFATSPAGSELSIRLPRSSVTHFPRLLERLDQQLTSLGIRSYGIETTTLEEVFMRIVNEDPEQHLKDPARANRLLTATREEYQENQQALIARDTQRIRSAVTDQDLELLLTKGLVALRQSSSAAAPPAALIASLGWPIYLSQTPVMLWKRVFQFGRSKAQWTMGVVIPFLLAILIALLLSSLPDDLLAPTPSPTIPLTSSAFPTFVAGPSQTMTTLTKAFAHEPIQLDDVGESYTAMFAQISEVAATAGSDGTSSSSSYSPSVSGLYYPSLTNFSVAYNASYPLNFAADVQRLLETTIDNVTHSRLVLDQSFNQLPNFLLGKQLNNGFLLAILFSLLTGSFGAGISLIVSGERVSLVKHQQLASGASPAAYWLGNFLFDFSLLFGYVLVFATVLAIFEPSYFSSASTTSNGNDGFGIVVLSGIFFSIASIFRFYSLSYWIADIRLAQSFYFYGSLAIMFGEISLWFTILFTTALANINQGQVKLVSALLALFDPTFGWYLVVLFQRNFMAIQTSNPDKAFWSTSVAGLILAMMVLSSVIYAVLFLFFREKAICCECFSVTAPSTTVGASHLIVSDDDPHDRDDEERTNRRHPISSSASSPFSRHNPAAGSSTQTKKEKKKMTMRRDPQAKEEAEAGTVITSEPKTNQAALPPRSSVLTAGDGHDPDVLRERDRVKAILQRGILHRRASTIFLHALRKVYFARCNTPAKVAVKQMHLSIGQGEIFGLLGANGAGKTTLLKMISGLETPTSGLAMINGFDVVSQTAKAQQSIGLCPQFDTLIERLSVKENLLFFARLKGLSPSSLQEEVCEAFMKALNIKKYQDKWIQHLSGGNRRKVSLAIALLGAPPTVYLDEPSTGLDPVASRLMWRLLSQIRQTKTTAMVLTTHNMLECEAVCSRIGIMKAGQLVCVGDSQHLRSSHGKGFFLELTLLEERGKARAKEFVESQFPNALLTEEHATVLHYEVPRASIRSLAEAFQILEESKSLLGFEDYVLSQSTLEQVFLKQIRSNEADATATTPLLPLDEDDPDRVMARKPYLRDYFTGYFVWFLAVIIPGLHHFYLGNFWRGMKYLVTINEAQAGWLLDLFEMHMLIQKSVQEKGHVLGCCYCSCCAYNPCCCCLWSCFPSSQAVTDTSRNPQRYGGVVDHDVEQGFQPDDDAQL